MDPPTKDFTKMGRRTKRASMYGVMGPIMMAIGRKTRLPEK